MREQRPKGWIFKLCVKRLDEVHPGPKIWIFSLLAEVRENRDLVAAPDVDELDDGRDRRGRDDQESTDRRDGGPNFQRHERAVRVTPINGPAERESA